MRFIQTLILAITLTFVFVSSGLALQTEEGETQHIRVKNNSAMMFAHKNYFFTLTSGPVGSEGIPAEIHIGDTVRVKDRVLTVKHILWTRFLERAQYGRDVLGEAGDVHCVLVEKLEDLPDKDSEKWRDRLWINVKQCEVINSGQSLSHTIRTWEEWCEQLSGKDLLKKFNTQDIRYDEEEIRADFVHRFRRAFLKQSVEDLLARKGDPKGEIEKAFAENELIEVWIEGNNLVLRNAVFMTVQQFGIDDFISTVEQYKKKLATFRDSKAKQNLGQQGYCLYAAMNSFFQNLVIEGDKERSAKIPLDFKRKQAIEEQGKKFPSVTAIHRAARALERSDFATAFRELQPVAKEGYAKAQFQLAGLYQEGLGVKKDNKAAIEWYTKAAQQDYAPAQMNLANIYAEGNEVPKDNTIAAKWYQAAAENGLEDAQYAIGNIYMFGHGVDRNPTLAISWWKKAADQDYAPALHHLGISYRDGIGVGKDQEKARGFFLKAATQGYPNAQHALGHMYLNGWGGSKDAREGAKWIKEAAEKGHVEAQTLIAALYLKGEGVKQDLPAAYMWLSLASSKGHADASHLRDTLARTMTPDQIAEAQRMAREWKPKR